MTVCRHGGVGGENETTAKQRRATELGRSPEATSARSLGTRQDRAIRTNVTEIRPKRKSQPVLRWDQKRQRQSTLHNHREADIYAYECTNQETNTRNESF